LLTLGRDGLAVPLSDSGGQLLTLGGDGLAVPLSIPLPLSKGSARSAEWYILFTDLLLLSKNPTCVLSSIKSENKLINPGVINKTSKLPTRIGLKDSKYPII
jgi:hypothetical protein